MDSHRPGVDGIWFCRGTICDSAFIKRGFIDSIQNFPLLCPIRNFYRVNFEVNNLKPFPYLAFPHSKGSKTASKCLVLMAS